MSADPGLPPSARVLPIPDPTQAPAPLTADGYIALADAAERELHRGDRSKLTFPVVGIGASAGGVEALLRLFSAMPADTGCAFVIVMHLAAERPSMLDTLIGRRSAMPVRQIEHDTEVLPNHVYVGPPGQYVALEAGRLRIVAIGDRPPRPISVDRFMASLAAHQGERAIGIVLTGADADGSMGLKAIKSEGGFTIAQSPGSASTPDMPRSAVATGVVDRQLSLEQMPQAIVDFATRAPVFADVPAEPQAPAAEPMGDGADAAHAGLAAILERLRTRFNIDFRGYRKPMLLRRVRRRMALLRADSMAAYDALLASDRAEAAALRDDLLINVTEFFREPEAWQVMAHDILPRLLQHKMPGSSLRVWVPACSTGEEAYSFAMLLHECPEVQALDLKVQIFGTDVDTNALDTARRGRYAHAIEHVVSAERLRRFFMHADGDYQVRKALREMVMFAPQNVAKDPPFSRIDILSCRNMLIYMEPALQQHVLAAFHFSLEPHGILCLGRSETVGSNSTFFAPYAEQARVFQRVGQPRVRPPFAETPVLVRSPLAKAPPTLPQPASDYTRLVDEALPDPRLPAVLMHRDGQALYFHGDVHDFLGQPQGEVTHDLFSMVLDDLRPWFRVAVHRASQLQTPVSTRATLGEGAAARAVQIHVTPLTDPGTEALLLVSFDSAAQLPPLPDGAEHASPSAMKALDDELRRTRAELRAAIEQLEAANEELMVANEEAMSANEELQSSNEELETSKEELESINEELTTVNAQLLEKVNELEVSNDDLDNLLSSTVTPTLFLDRELRIQRFTPAATRLFRLLPSDVKRPLTDLASQIDLLSLLDDVKQVLTDLQTHEREISTPDGEWFLRRALPYRTKEDRIDGVVVTFTDISAIKRNEEALRRYAAVLQGSEDAIVLHSLDGKILGWNRGATELYGSDEADVMASAFDDWIAPSARAEHAELVQGLLAGRRVRAQHSQRCRRDKTLVEVMMSMTLVTDEHGRPSAVALVERDVTLQRHAERALRESEQRFRSLADSAPALIWISDPQHKVQFANHEFSAFTGVDAAHLAGRPWFGLLHGDDQARARAAFAAPVVTAGKPRVEGNARLLSRDGNYRWVKIAAHAEVAVSPGEHSWVGSMVDIDAQYRAEAGLHDAAQRKDEFLAMLGHELRNPLAPIRNAAEVLGRLSQGDQRLDWVHSTLVRQVDHVTRLVDDLLDIAQVTRGTLQVHTEPVDLNHTVSRAIESSQGVVQRKRQQLDIELPEAPLWVEGDAVRLVQIFQNLIVNAAKYTDEGGRLHLSLREDKGMALFVLNDSGIGIAPEMRARIFDLFVQDQRAVDRSQGGLGIGLALVRHLVNLHRGSIEAFSEGVGRGSEFCVRLPLLPAASIPVRQDAPVQVQRGHGRVLIVDDDHEGGQSLKMLLDMDGYQVGHADGLAAALRLARETPPQVVLMDIAMPEVDGYEVARRLRELPGWDPQTKFVALTGFAQSEDARRSKREGFAAHLVKPVNPSQLERLLKQWLQDEGAG